MTVTRWIRAILGRFLQFLLVGLVLCCGPCLAIEDAWLRVRAALFVSIALLLYAEQSQVNSAIRRLREVVSGTKDGQPTPKRRRSAAGVLLFLTALSMWFVWFTLTSAVVRDVAAESILGALLLSSGIALAWSFMTWSVVRLVASGVLRLRLRWAARGKETDPQRRPTPVFPFLVSGWSTLILGVALGFPTPGQLLWALWVAVTLDELRSATTAAIGTPSPTTNVLVTLAPGSTPLDVDALTPTGAWATPAFPNDPPAIDPLLGNTYQVTVPASEITALSLLLALDRQDVLQFQLDSAVVVDPVGVGATCIPGLVALPTNDPLASAQAGLWQVGGARVLNDLAYRTPQAVAVVAIIDTGVSGLHPDLRDVMLPWAISDDAQGHGTAVAGVAGAMTDNWSGITSFNHGGRFVRLRSYPALSGRTPRASDVAGAIDDAMDDGVAVINLSFSGTGAAHYLVQRAIERATAAGIVVVAAAGNNGHDASAVWPANAPGVLVVGATAPNGLPAPFSNTTYGVLDAVWAPGTDVCTLTPNGDYALQSGTSFAAPTVAGLAGVMRSLCPTVTATEVVTIVESTATAGPGWGLGGGLRADLALAELYRRHPTCEAATRSGGWPRPTSVGIGLASPGVHPASIPASVPPGVIRSPPVTGDPLPSLLDPPPQVERDTGSAP